jgi:hypothetical protein
MRPHLSYLSQALDASDKYTQQNYELLTDKWISPSSTEDDLPDVVEPGGPRPAHGGGLKPAAASKTSSKLVDMWLVDTGCGHDLIGRKSYGLNESSFVHADVPLTFGTANGEAIAAYQYPINLVELGYEISPYVLKDTPAVLTVGGRCLNDDFSFFWPNRSRPYFLDPKGRVIELDIIDDIPYLLRGASSRPICKDDVNKLQSIISHAKANPAYLTQSRINLTDNGKGGRQTALPVPEVEAAVPAEDSDASLVTDDEAAPAPGAAPPPPAPAAGERRPPRDLRADAVSVRHLLTHKPKNKYCDSCNRGKMQNAKKFDRRL